MNNNIIFRKILKFNDDIYAEMGRVMYRSVGNLPEAHPSVKNMIENSASSIRDFIETALGIGGGGLVVYGAYDISCKNMCGFVRATVRGYGAEVHNLFVDSDYQRKLRIGTNLLKNAEKSFAKQGAKFVRIWPMKKTGSVNFYEKQGYNMKDGVMVKEL